MNGKPEIETLNAPKPVGSYPHARRVAEFLFLSGMGPRQPGSDTIPGGPIFDETGPLPYDVAKQTRATLENVRAVLDEAGAGFEDIVDVTVFLVNMARDFPTFNDIYSEYFPKASATRTTVEVGALPTPIAVELKVIAWLGDR